MGHSTKLYYKIQVSTICWLFCDLFIFWFKINSPVLRILLYKFCSLEINGTWRYQSEEFNIQCLMAILTNFHPKSAAYEIFSKNVKSEILKYTHQILELFKLSKYFVILLKESFCQSCLFCRPGHTLVANIGSSDDLGYTIVDCSAARRMELNSN